MTKVDRAVTASPSARLPADHAGPSSDALGRARTTAQSGGRSRRVAAYFLVWLAVYAGYLDDRTPNGLLTVSLLAAAWILAFRSAFAAGHYTVDSTITVAIGTVTGLVLASALNEWVPGLGLTVPRLLATAAAIFGLVSVWEWLVRRAGMTQWRVLVVGSPGIADALVEEVRRTRVPFDVVGTVGNASVPSSERVPLMGALVDLPTIVETVHPELIVLADSPECDAAVERLLEIPRRRFRVVGLLSFYEWAFGRVPVPYLTPSWFMSLIHLRQRVSARWSKRTFDVALASFALAVLAPVLLVIALLVATTAGPIIFRQTRIGERGRLFRIYKFRTMRADAEGVGGPVWASAGDPRATRVGRLLRRTHLDELPQLLNVLRGDMSIVGPRPERPEFIELLEGVVPSWGRRLLVKPGMTGWAQVRSGYAADCDSTAVKLSYDLWYLRHRNLVIDLAVCAKTFFVVLGLGPREHRIEPPGAPRAGRGERRTLVTPSVGAALALCLTGLGANGSAGPAPVTEAESTLPRAQPPVPPLHVTPPLPPSTYRVPEGAMRVSTSAELRAALARRHARRIVLAPGTYRSPRPFLNPHGHRLYAARLGTVVLEAGLSLGGNEGRGGGLVRGIVFDVKTRSGTVDGAIIEVWGTGRNSAVLDSTLRGNGVVSAAIVARRRLRPDPAAPRRAGFSNYGIVVDANDLSPRASRRFWISDLDVAHVSRRVRGSSEGRAEACVWIGNSGRSAEYGRRTARGRGSGRAPLPASPRSRTSMSPEHRLASTSNTSRVTASSGGFASGRA